MVVLGLFGYYSFFLPLCGSGIQTRERERESCLSFSFCVYVCGDGGRDGGGDDKRR